ncbi:hypothetical protein, partial [Paraburkholderia tropica]|uniref:hypothetical protein n=1 Tax=Paraburkholderia tropica TaxID=92647 RepID=UPI003D6D49A5
GTADAIHRVAPKASDRPLVPDSLAVCAPADNANQPHLPAHRQCALALNHRFTLSIPALPSALSKKSFSRVN